MDDNELIRVTLAAAKDLIDQDAELLTNNAHEQALTHRLGVYIERRVPGWKVDCEYNRNGEVVKRLPADIDHPIPDITDQTGVPIVPDIVIHERLVKNNLLVIEAKKVGNPKIQHDDWKLRGMTRIGGQYEYQLGVHFIFLGTPPSINTIRCYKDGRPNVELTELAQGVRAELGM